jgi:CRP/FNR family transcriptional regulator, cyclic AMP receptor protein
MQAVTVPQILSATDLFRDLPRDDLETLESQMQRKSFPAGTLLISPEQGGEALFVILEGTVKIFLHREDGSEVIFALLGAGQTVGEMSVFARGLRSANVLTMERTVLLAMSGSAFQSCLQSMPALSYNLNCLLVTRLRAANQQILALSSLDVGGRVAHEILTFAEQFGRAANGENAVHIPVRLTQGDLAAIVGTSRERVNQVMVGFKQRGYLSVDRSYHITVHDRDALARRCNWASA